MTTLDTVLTFAARVEESAQRKRQRKPIDWRRVFLAMLAALPYLVGRLAGRTVYALRIMASATREGYREGNQAPARRRAVAVAASTVDG